MAAKKISAEELIKIVRAGDRLTIKNRFDQTHSGRVVMKAQHGGWVLNMGGKHGTPGIATTANVVGGTVNKQKYIVENKRVIAEVLSLIANPKIDDNNETIKFANNTDLRTMRAALRYRNIKYITSRNTVKFNNSDDFAIAKNMISETIHHSTSKNKNSIKLSELRGMVREAINEYLNPKINKEKESITFINDADTKKMKAALKRKNISFSGTGKTIKFNNTAEFKKAQGMLSKSLNEAVTVKGRNNSTGESFGVVIGSAREENGSFLVNVRKSYSSRISEMEHKFDENGNLINTVDFGYKVGGGSPDTSGGHGYHHIGTKSDTIKYLSEEYSPAFAKKLILFMKEKIKELSKNINEDAYGNSKADAMNAYFTGKVTAAELIKKFGKNKVATKSELQMFLSNKFMQAIMADTYDISKDVLVTKVKELLKEY